MWRVAVLRPIRRMQLLDLVAPGSAMSIGALPILADGPHPRALTQAWARAISEDHPAGAPVQGIRYRSAYNGGTALVLWGERLPVAPVVPKGDLPDYALQEPEIFGRLVTALGHRRIALTTVSPDGCSICWSRKARG